jgi:hypothetical protein
MKRTTHQTATILIAALASAWLPAALSQTPPSESLNIRQVALFKNGLGFFVGQVTCPEGQSSFQVALPVAPSHGTFWLSYPTDLALASVTARQIESQESVEAISVSELLQANPGRRVRLMVGDREIVGAIRYVARDRDAPRRDPYTPGRQPEPTAYRPWEQPQQGGLLVVETETGDLSLDPRLVTQAAFPDGRAERSLLKPRRRAVLQVRLKEPAPTVKLTVSFLGKGATWAPSYMVDITEAGTARLSAKALVINDACELKDTDVQLVTGFPHLQFADIVSPVGMKQDLAQFLQALAAGRSEQGTPNILSNVMTQSVSYRGRGDSADMPAYGAAEVGQTAEDLFLYPAGPLDLGREEVAYVPLFTETVPCKHIYQWDIPDFVSEESQYQPGGDRIAAVEEEVWHSLRLTNSTKVPWTTAPGETVKGGIILGQDTLRYTPPKAESTLRITRAVGVKAEQREFETDRKREAARMYGYSYDLITVRGDLSIANFQDKAIDLEITKNLSGEVTSTDPGARIEKLAAGLRRMNGLRKLTWTLQLNPGEKKDISYVYEVYIRR